MKKDPVLITATSDGSISLWNTKQSQWFQEDTESPKNDFNINRLALSMDKLKLAAACSDGVRLYDVRAQKPNFKIRKNVDDRNNVISIGFDIYSNWAYFTTESGCLNIVDLRDGKINNVLK